MTADHLQTIEYLLAEAHLTEIHQHLVKYIRNTNLDHVYWNKENHAIIISDNLMFLGSPNLDNSLLFTHKYRLILSLSLTQALQKPIQILEIRREVYPDMCGSKKTLEATIQIY